MSYDIWLEIDTGAGNTLQIEVGNFTSNVAPMWHKALWEGDALHEIAGNGYSLQPLHGLNAGTCIPLLTRAVKRMTDDMASYEQMNPENGWGNAEGACDYLDRLLAVCLNHPKCTICVSY